MKEDFPEWLLFEDDRLRRQRAAEERKQREAHRMKREKRHNVFISFDYDNDLQLKEGLIGQSRNDNSPFEVADFSMKEAAPQSKWRAEARRRISRCSVVIVMCGRHTDQAPGVSAEITIAREIGKPYFLLRGYSKWTCVKPKGAKASDKMYNWTWKNLELLLDGRR